MITIIRHSLNVLYIIISFDFIIHIIQWKKIHQSRAYRAGKLGIWYCWADKNIQKNVHVMICDLKAKVLGHVVKMDSYLLMA